jgi:hypothetical protein
MLWIENMDKRRDLSERGQSLVLVALLFLAFVAILALVLDGGNAYAARRTAQNAADAGALAGASYMCEHRDAAGGLNKAVEFAVKNGAVNPPEVIASMITGSVVVTATVQADTFFAGFIGFNQVSPRAVAEAQCRPPAAMGVLPVAWSCRETVIMGEVLPGRGCAQRFGPCKTAGDPHGLNCTYVLMDSVKVREHGKPCDPSITDPADSNYCYTQNDLVCDELLDDNGNHIIDDVEFTTLTTGTIDCDLNDDGINDLMAGGARSWLDLNGGGGGASELSDWIKNGFPTSVNPHSWLPEESGVATSIFKDASTMVTKDVILPVFDKLCPNYPNDYSAPETLAACNYGAIDDRTKAGSNMNFHVISFSKFHVTCVQTGKNRVWSEPALGLFGNQPCPGHDRAVNNLPNPSIDENDKTIEGYFINDQIYGYGGSGSFVDTGTFVVVLVR